MARILTARFVDTVAPKAKPVEYGDTSGGRLLVHPSGRKTWIHRYREPDGRTRKDTLGPAVGEGAISLATMRETVAKARRELEQGIAIPRSVPMTAGESVASHATQFLAKHHAVKNRPATAAAAERTFNNIVLPAWGTRAVDSIRRRDIIALVEATVVERGPVAAAGLVRMLSKFFNWLLVRDAIGSSPAVGVSAILPPQKPRQRALTDAEVAALFRAADTDHPSDRAVQVLVLTGCRRNEVGGMRWSEIDQQTRIWVIPAERAKNGREHRVPLSEQAWRIIDSQPHIVDCDYVFSNGRTSINGDWAQTKRRLSAKAGLVEDWRLHDLRRTVAAGLQRLRIRTEVIERVLGHYSASFAGIVGTYQVDPLEHEVGVALQRWADRVTDLVAGRDSATILRLKA